uniref:NADH-ubiquinone oxidoreductase chain 2 n=1 Tax=Bothrogonia tongmaiana TaxID=1030435 RepID=A0A7D5YAY3_9HEMI|nr:NADH dehydrogenase subunit 2 [Bothrogonia tongmaiana]QLI54087.1 NADH dehydrogenase subunit 2 [Bothrogonia tongmaiana]
MVMNSTLFLFMNTMVLGVLVSISTNNFIMLWSGLELSLMSFIPMMSSKNLLSSESMMKYFIVQSMSSSIMISGLVLMGINTMQSEYLIVTSVLIKIGMAPFHNWMLTVIEGMSYQMILIMLTMMKVPPLMVISYMNVTLYLPIIISLIVGAIWGINQNSVRKMLGYSSIYNMAYMCSCIKMISIWSMFMINYSIIITSVLLMFMKLNIYYFNQMMVNSFNKSMNISIWMLMLSLGGIPPMMGFLGKLMVLEYLLSINQFALTALMVVSSLPVMFYYMRCSFMSMTMSSISMKWLTLSPSKILNNLLIINILMTITLISVKSLN